MDRHIPATVRESFLRQGQADSLNDIINAFSKAFDAVINSPNADETDREKRPMARIKIQQTKHARIRAEYVNTGKS